MPTRFIRRTCGVTPDANARAQHPAADLDPTKLPDDAPTDPQSPSLPDSPFCLYLMRRKMRVL